MLWPRTIRGLWTWDPRRDLRRLQTEMARLFGDYWPPMGSRTFPATNLWTGRDGAVVTAQIPGVAPDQIELSVQGDTLVIGGSRDAYALGEGERYVRQERETGAFTRTIQLPFRVEPDKVEASYAQGILTVTLPRLDADKPKQISVQART